ncbi:MAG TPA: acyltransferase [Burkholderiaceae bacterium]
MNPAPQNSRLSGLDTLRAAAIVLVLLYHFEVVVSGASTFSFIGDCGWAGVDLFFVLSGYLIGNQIMGPIARGEPFSFKLFYVCRFLRTLPNYYVILALYFLFPLAMAGKEPMPLWRFLSFTQNIGLRPGSAFSHAWSLNVEEQFYLILPLAAFGLAALRRSLLGAWFVLVAAIFAGIAMRGLMWLHCADFQDYMSGIYYSSFCRMDELLPGVALAMLKNFHGGLYLRLQAWGNRAAAAGLAVVALVLAGFYYCLDGDYVAAHGFNFPVIVFGYSVLALGFMLMVFSALCRSSFLSRLRIPGAQALALWSYAVYLAHKPLFYIGKMHLPKFGIEPDSWSGILIIMVAGVLGGYLLFRIVETPFMHLRERLFGWAPPTSVEVVTVKAVEVQ